METRCLSFLFVFIVPIFFWQEASARKIPRCDEISRDSRRLFQRRQSLSLLYRSCKKRKTLSRFCKYFPRDLRSYYLQFLRVKYEDWKHECSGGVMKLRGELKKLLADKKYNKVRCKAVKESMRQQKSKYDYVKRRSAWLCGSGKTDQRWCDAARKTLAKWTKIRRASRDMHKASACSFPWK